ncbi:MAG: saccharopine dehydrogenase NADP-binding domain-containing protein [Anaerolineales bacterium]|nr:saccharopine dehydrogenase NADP-binding domain-containing protein [Anaerolineales bacterium]
MKVLLLGGIGGVSLDASQDIFQNGGFDEIILADANLKRAQDLGKEMGLPSKSVVHIDASDQSALTELMRGFDVVLNGLPKLLAPNVLKAAIQVGAHVADLGSPTADLEAFDEEARKAGITYLAGCGATPGITNMMALQGAKQLDVVDEINVNFAAFRSFGLSPALIHTTLWEFDPEIKERAYYQDGQFHSVPPFSGERVIQFPDPIGAQQVYFVPHGETRTFPRTLNPKRVFTRGCFPPRVMRFLRVILEFGFYRTEPIQIDGAQIGPRQLLTEYLLGVPEGNQQDIWGYGLLVEVIGQKSGGQYKYASYTTHPGMDEWGVPEAYTKNVALPLAVGVRLLMQGQQRDYGVGAPETILPSESFFEGLAERKITLHESIQEI